MLPRQKLFDIPSIRNAVINIGDPFGAELVRRLHGRAEIIAVALVGQVSVDELPALRVEVVESDADGLLLRFSGAYGMAEMRSSLWGRFNAENLLVAAGNIARTRLRFAASGRCAGTVCATTGADAGCSR